MRKRPESKPYVSMTEGLGGRLKSDYVAYAVKKYGGNVASLRSNGTSLTWPTVPMIKGTSTRQK